MYLKRKTQLIEATVASLKSISTKRFYKTERGFQGRLYCALQTELDGRSVLTKDLILEMEYQKGARHGTTQRPDIIMHIPVEISKAAINENNHAVWALKRRASRNKAKEDYCKLNEMFRGLNYQYGFFINIDSKYHYLDDTIHECHNPYEDVYLSFRNRLVAIATQLDYPDVIIKVAYWQNNEIIEEVF